MAENALYRFGYGSAAQPYYGGEEYQNALAAGLVRERQSGWDRDALLPLAREMRDGQVVRGNGLFGSDWHLAVPQFAADIGKAAYGVAQSPVLSPLPVDNQYRTQQIEGAEAVVGPQVAAGFIRNALRPMPGSAVGSGGGSRRLGGSHEPTLQQTDPMAIDQTARRTLAIEDRPAPESRSSTQNDPLSGALDLSPEALALREAYQQRKPIPDGWYVHGRSNGTALRDDAVIQATRNYNIMEQYGKSGSGWAIRPKEGARALDAAGSELQKIAQTMMSDYRNGVLPVDIQNALPRNPKVADFYNVAREFAPERIVDSAGAFDNVNWVNWLADRMKADFVHTPDGAVALHPDAVDAVRLFSDNIGPQPLNALMKEARSQQPGIRAYHGSPHDFDKFSLDKIGTGEGAQAYGHGLYFAENEGVAKSYRDQLGDYSNSVKWKGSEPPTPLQQTLINQLSGLDARTGQMMTPARLRADLGRSLMDAEHGMFPDPKRAAELRAQRDELQRIEPFIETTPPGRMYEVNIKADPESFLDWDKPLSQQSEKVRAALNADESLSGGDAYKAASEKLIPALPLDPPGTPKGWGFVQRGDEGQPALSKRLREQGVAGIRYLDASSRTKGEGSRNYVVFDDSLIEILRKYGLAGMMAGGASLASQGDQQQ